MAATAAAAAAMVTMSFPSKSLLRRPLVRPISASFSTESNPQQHRKQLILYSKPGCCLCDGLKEKLQAAFSLDGAYSLRSVQLQVRDITENSEWESRYQYEIPVLAKILPDGTEETLPRLSPRLGVELIQKKIAAALEC